MEFDLDHALAILARTPATLDRLLRDLPEGWGGVKEGEKKWSAFDVVGHLVHGERADWVDRAKIILTEGEGREFDPFDRTARFEASRGKSMEDLLDLFRDLRARNLSMLREWKVTPSQLDRTGRHPKFGVVTLRQLLSAWVVHDLGHIGQICRALAKQYTAAVGPWVEFMPVLRG